MTVNNSAGIVKYIANGETKEFSVSYPFFLKKDGTAELAVYVSSNVWPLTQNVDYTINYNNSQNTGFVVFNTAPQKGVIIAIIRNIEAVQETQFIEGAKFPAIAFELALDRQIMLIQSLQEQISRCLALDPTDMESSKSIKDTLLEQIRQISKGVNEALSAVNQVREIQTSITQYVKEAEHHAKNASSAADEVVNAIGILENELDQINGEVI